VVAEAAEETKIDKLKEYWQPNAIDELIHE
jgi:hypothetical protein